MTRMERTLELLPRIYLNDGARALLVSLLRMCWWRCCVPGWWRWLSAHRRPDPTTDVSQT